MAVREEISEIAFTDLEGWIKTRMEEELEAIKPDVNHIRERVHAVMNSMKSLGDELKKVEVKQDQVAGQYMPVINDAKKTLHVAIKKETSEQLPEIKSFEDVLAVRDRIKKLLGRLGDTSASHRKVIHNFFARHGKTLKLQLGMMSREERNLNQLIDGYMEKTSSLTKCGENISRISYGLRESSDLARKSKELKDELGTLRGRETEAAGKIDALQGTEGFKQYKTDKEELARVRKDTERLVSEIGAAFSKISRALGKYTYEVGLEKESKQLIQSVMDDSVNLLRNPRLELLTETLAKVRDAVRSGKIVVKNPDKDVENITALMNNAGQYMDAHKKLSSRIEELGTRTSPVETNLKRLRYELDRIRSDVAQKESTLNESSRRLAETRSSISSELKSIEERIEEATNSRIKVSI